MSAVEKLSCPPVSIILAVRNEETHLERCLESIAAQDYPVEMIETILVDGMSTDRTGQIIEDWQLRDTRIRSFENADRVVFTGVNIGIKESRYDLILWVSGHALLQADHLRKCVETMHRTDAAAVGGVLTTKGVGRIGKLNAAVLSHPFGVGNAAHRVGRESGWVPAVTMALYRKSAILDVGGFDQSLPRSQDNDLHDRMNKRGHRSFMDVSINPRYLCRGTYGGLLECDAQPHGTTRVQLASFCPNDLCSFTYRARHLLAGFGVLSLLAVWSAADLPGSRFDRVIINWHQEATWMAASAAPLLFS